MSNHKLFSSDSERYARVRPKYPPTIFEYLASICRYKTIAWDAACGSGQAAVGLARHFRRVEATDVSIEQIAHAIQIPNVNYSVQHSEKTNFDDNQFDIVCVAQALHWFDIEAFWEELKRVLKSAGIFAAWGYSWFSIEEPIDRIVKKSFLSHLEPFWAPQNKLLWDNYRDIPFPLARIHVPKFEMKMEWDLDQLFAYLKSWSAVQLCIEQNGNQFIENAYAAIESEWGDGREKRTIEMNFCMLAGRNGT